MTNLKTLKDLKHLVKREEGIPDYEAVDLLTLKSEAIKWVKEFQGKDWENVEGLTDFGGSISKFIKHFFNITEEDLK